MKKNCLLKSAAGALLLGVFALSSCVQGDMYDLFDDEFESGFVRSKRSKDYGGGNSGGNSSQCPYLARDGQCVPVPPGFGGCSFRAAYLVLDDPVGSITNALQDYINNSSGSTKRNLKKKYCHGGDTVDPSTINAEVFDDWWMVERAYKLENNGNGFTHKTATQISQGDIVLTYPPSKWGESGSSGHVMLATSAAYQNDYQQWFFEGDGYVWGKDWVADVISF